MSAVGSLSISQNNRELAKEVQRIPFGNDEEQQKVYHRVMAAAVQLGKINTDMGNVKQDYSELPGAIICRSDFCKGEMRLSKKPKRLPTDPRHTQNTPRVCCVCGWQVGKNRSEKQDYFKDVRRRLAISLRCSSQYSAA
jgi:hypothetical protein